MRGAYKNNFAKIAQKFFGIVFFSIDVPKNILKIQRTRTIKVYNRHFQMDPVLVLTKVPTFHVFADHIFRP